MRRTEHGPSLLKRPEKRSTTRSFLLLIVSRSVGCAGLPFAPLGSLLYESRHNFSQIALAVLGEGDRVLEAPNAFVLPKKFSLQLLLAGSRRREKPVLHEPGRDPALLSNELQFLGASASGIGRRHDPLHRGLRDADALV